jgi:hypothetical protein
VFAGSGLAKTVAVSVCIPASAGAADTFKCPEIVGQNHSPAYKRSLYEHARCSWIDEDGDSKDSREEVLSANKDWDRRFCPFIGRVISNCLRLLSTGDQRLTWANDTKESHHSIALYNRANLSKDARDPASWLIPL